MKYRLAEPIEDVDRRVLGALRFVDAVSGLPVRKHLRLTTPGLTLIENRSGLNVIQSAAGLEDHTLPFEAPPTDPAPETFAFTVTVRDESGTYLARTAEVLLPRDPDGDLFEPIDVRLYPSPSAATEVGWALLRLSVRDQAGDPVPFASLLVTRRDDAGEELGRGMADERGEALVAVPGLPITTWGDSSEDAVLTHETLATLRVRLDASLDPAQDLPDPDAIAEEPVLPGNTFNDLTLVAGREQARDLNVFT